MPSWFPEPEILRILYGENWNYEVVYKASMNLMAWRETKLPLQLDDIHTQILKTGFLQYHGRDKFHRPVQILRPVVLVKAGFSDKIDEIVRVIFFTNFYVVNHLHC